MNMKLHTFECRSGGAPRGHVDVPEMARYERAVYYSPGLARWAKEGQVVILCAEASGIANDPDGFRTYVTPGGVVFAFHYSPGDGDRFDTGRIVYLGYLRDGRLVRPQPSVPAYKVEPQWPEKV